MSLSTSQSSLKMCGKVGSDTPLLHGGGSSRVIRRICVISVAAAERPAAQKYHFGGFSRTSRRQFSGSIAIYAANAVTIAIFAAF